MKVHQGWHYHSRSSETGPVFGTIMIAIVAIAGILFASGY